MPLPCIHGHCLCQPAPFPHKQQHHMSKRHTSYTLSIIGLRPGWRIARASGISKCQAMKFASLPMHAVLCVALHCRRQHMYHIHKNTSGCLQVSTTVITNLCGHAADDVTQSGLQTACSRPHRSLAELNTMQLPKYHSAIIVYCHQAAPPELILLKRVQLKTVTITAVELHTAIRLVHIPNITMTYINGFQASWADSPEAGWHLLLYNVLHH